MQCRRADVDFAVEWLLRLGPLRERVRRQGNIVMSTRQAGGLQMKEQFRLSAVAGNYLRVGRCCAFCRGHDRAKAGAGGRLSERRDRALWHGAYDTSASFEALYNHKVDAGELNSEQLESATQRGHYKDGDLVFLWKSDPIPTDPVAIRGDLPAPFKKKLTEALQHLDLMSFDTAERKIMVGAGITQLVPETDSAYDGIRDLVKTLNIDLEKLG